MKKIIYLLILEVLLLGVLGIILPAVLPVYDILLIGLLKCISEALKNDLVQLALFMSTFLHKVIWIETVYRGLILLFFFLTAQTFLTKEDIQKIRNVTFLSSKKEWFLVLTGGLIIYGFCLIFFNCLIFAILSTIFTEEHWWIRLFGTMSALILQLIFFHKVIFSQPKKKQILEVLDM